MALLQLDKIVLHRTVLGVACPACKGVLHATTDNASWLWQLTGKKRKIMIYRCHDCQKQYRMAEIN